MAASPMYYYVRALFVLFHALRIRDEDHCVCQTAARNVKHIIFKEFHVNVIVSVWCWLAAVLSTALHRCCCREKFIDHRVVRRCLFCVEPHKQFQLEFLDL